MKEAEVIGEDGELKIPLASADLIKMLNERFPPRCPYFDEHPESVQRFAGKRELIDQLCSIMFGPDRKDWPS